MSHFTIPTFKLPEFVAKIGARLPQWPHALALVSGLNTAAKLKLLPEDSLQSLAGKTFLVAVNDTGGEARFTYANGWFRPVFGAAGEPDLTFRALLRHDRGYTGYLPLTRMPLLTALAARTPFAESFRDSVHPGGETPSVLAELTGLPEDEWPDRLRRLIVDQAGLILRRAIDPDRSFAEHGLDSLGMLELRTSVETQTGIRISPKTIVSYNTARSLAAHLSESLAAEA